MMQKPCQDSYYTLFSSYTMLLDYHEEQAKNSRWIRCKVADLQVEPLGESSPLILELYMPMIEHNSYLYGRLDEDLKQYILIHIALNISKFKI